MNNKFMHLTVRCKICIIIKNLLKGYMKASKHAKKALGVAKLLSYRVMLFAIIFITSFFSVFYAWQTPKKAEALETAKMLLYWDGGAAPTGWSIVSTYDGKYPRGEAPGNVLQTGGSGTHTPSVAGNSQSSNYPNTGGNSACTGGGSDILVPSNSHSHTITNPTMSAASNSDEPPFRTLKLIQYDAGIPTTIPSGAIAIFDTSPGASWTRLSAQDNQFIKISSTVGTTGGSETHTHTATWNSLGAASYDGNCQNGTNQTYAYAANGHTHAAPSSNSTISVTAVPPHIKPLLYKANSDVAAPNGLIAMFDANPGGGWTVQSNPGGTFYQQFLRPAATFDGTTTGAGTHFHINHTSGSTVTPCPCGTGFLGNGGTASAGTSHSHTVTVTFSGSPENLPEYFNVVIAKKSLPAMMLFWDGGVAPTGWTIVTDFDGRFPRGESPGNTGDLGGRNTHAHTIQNYSVGTPSNNTVASGISGTPATDTHTHSNGTVSATLDGADAGTDPDEVSSLPAYRTLKLIRYNNGVPSVIPSGAIAIFDNSPGVPGSGWTRYSAQDNQMVMVNSTAGTTGGTDTNHTHTTIFSGTTAGSTATGNRLSLLGGTAASANGHTHAVSGSSSSTGGSHIPPYIVPLLAKTNADTSTLSAGITAMFSGDPGSGWVIRSSNCGNSAVCPYYQKFLRPAAAYDGTGAGTSNHTHTASRTSNTSASSDGNANNGSGISSTAHTHSITATDYSGGSDPLNTAGDYFLPSYFNVVIAEKVDFKMETYFWYDNSGTAALSSRWGAALEVTQGSPIPTLPTAYRPPDLTDELRLRLKILVNNNDLLAGEVAYKLQYKKGTDGSCTSGSWTDVGTAGSGSIWRYTSSTAVADGAAVPSTVFSPASTVMQVYARSNPTASNPNAVVAGTTMEYDFHIQHNGAEGATEYNFRIVENSGDGVLLSEYTLCPTLVTKPQTSNQLRHGNFFESRSRRGAEVVDKPGVEAGFSWAD
jgi:hypothetical protein